MSAVRYLRVTTDAGIQYVSEFHKLGFPEKYFQKVLRAGKIFNVWNVVSETHPQSGEAVLIRRRIMLNPTRIVSVEEVEPDVRTGPDDYNPSHFKAKALIEKGAFGLWTAPTEEGALVVDALPGAKYPIRRDNDSLRRYVVLRAGEGEDEVRHWLDEAQPAYSTGREEPTSGGADDYEEDEDDEDMR